MPNHIHVVLILESEAAGASPRPTITDIVCAYKSLTTRECKKNGFDGKLFQTSFYECSVGANCVRPQNLPLSNIGKIVLDELERRNQTYPAVSLYSYVIMPNHLHIMVVISADEYGRPQVAPTVERMVKQFKGASTKKIGAPIWQKSYIEHVIRNKKDYQTRSNYIYENPIRWYYDELYTEEYGNGICLKPSKAER